MARGGFRPGAGRPKKTGGTKPAKGNNISAFIVNGKNRSFADVIMDHATSGDSCIVATYGFGTAQVDKLALVFSSFVLIADESHSKLNKKAFDYVSEMNGKNGFTFIPIKNHAKMAIVNHKTLIFTSANLSSNHRLETYLVAPMDAINGIDDILETLSNPQKLISEGKHNEEDKDDSEPDNYAPLEFLLAQMNNKNLPLDFRARMATAAAPFVHSRKGEGGGKKDEREAKAKTAGSGKFAASPPPLRAVK